MVKTGADYLKRKNLISFSFASNRRILQNGDSRMADSNQNSIYPLLIITVDRKIPKLFFSSLKMKIGVPK